MIDWKELGLKLAETAIREIGTWIKDARKTPPALPECVTSHICFRCGVTDTRLDLYPKYVGESEVRDYAHGPTHADCP